MPTEQEFDRIERRGRRRARLDRWFTAVDRPWFWVVTFWTGILVGVAVRKELDDKAWLTLAVLGGWVVWGTDRTLFRRPS
jgi:hypothetical protein